MSDIGKIVITKASGETSIFSEEKLRNSLTRAGADDSQIDHILKIVSEKLTPGISTKKIYHIAFNELKRSSRFVAGRYHLKRAIMELEPSGYPFEKYIGELLKCQGFNVAVGQFMKGRCVTHEIDVIATADHHYFMIECKYHNLPGVISDVKIPLYIQSRFKDIEEVWLKTPGHENALHQGWVVTNTKFSSDAIKYGMCVGLKLWSWDYPEQEGLRNVIDRFGLYPITCLTTLTRFEKQKLLEKKIVLCREILENPDLLKDVRIKQGKISQVINESTKMCNTISV